nr:hypothetical protein [Anaerococcus mediterraneensis]
MTYFGFSWFFLVGFGFLWSIVIGGGLILAGGGCRWRFLSTVGREWI